MLSEKCKLQAQIQAGCQRQITICQLLDLNNSYNEIDKFCSVIVNTYIPLVAIWGSFLHLQEMVQV